MKPPTLKCIAERAMVGRSTVSLILNGRGDEVGIRRETQEHVLSIAREFNYRANPLAQGLAGKAMKLVGVVWSFAMYHPNHLLRSSLTLRIHSRGYRTYMVDSLSEPQKVRADLEDLILRGIDALVINVRPETMAEAGFADVLERIPKKVVVLDDVDPVEPRHGCRVIHRNYGPALREVVEHLVATGRQRPVIVSSTSGNGVKIERFRELYREASGTDQEVPLFPLGRCPRNKSRIRDTYESLEAQSFDGREYDAAFCTSDDVAAAVMKRVRAQGLRVPEDMAVVGFNDDPFCEALTPPLASVAWQTDAVVDLIDEALFDQLEGAGTPQREESPPVVEVPLHFVCRDSAAPVPERAVRP